MGRIRSIKPEFPQSESMGRLSREARLTFILLWTIVDDAGRTRDSSRLLASMLYPYDDDAPKLIGGWLDELEREGCIVRYSVVHEGEKEAVVKSSQKKLGEPHVNSSFAKGPGSSKAGHIVDHYLEINKWLTHQKIDHPTPSKLPPLDASLSKIGEHFASPRETFAPDQDMDMDMDRDQDRDQDPDAEVKKQTSLSCAELRDEAAPSTPPLNGSGILMVTCTGELWEVPVPKVKEWEESFPDVDVRLTLLGARQWLRDHPRRRKTAKGMVSFLGDWMRREQDKPDPPGAQHAKTTRH